MSACRFGKMIDDWTHRVQGYEDAVDQMCQDFEQRFKLYLLAAESALGESYAGTVRGR